MTPSPRVFIIGTVSLDTLHLGDRIVHTIGGAGLYTALAVRQAGASVGLLAPRPTPLPAVLRPAAERLHWIGPAIAPEALPRLAIAHHGGGRATLLEASWGAEAQLVPALLPAEVSQTTYVHIAALSTARRQLEFAQALLAGRRGGDRPRLSAGTYARLVHGETTDVRRLIDQTDVFFMNANEARGLFGSLEQASSRPDALLFVTLGADGVLVVAGDRVTHVPGCPVAEVDPTGAGDTFCGAVLAYLARGSSPVPAAEQAVALAARTVGAAGPTALLEARRSR
jgi:ribokinase